MKVIAINGSPRKQGNTALLLDTVLAELKNEGIETEHIQLGQSYVYLDGFFIPADETDFEVRGWHAKHQFTKVPQVLALEDETIVEQVLGNPDYWTENEITDREE